MKEKITGRVGRIISGGFHALLDAVESTAPEVVMEQALREVDEAIADVRNELGKVIANKHLANSRLMQVNQKCEELNEKVELAVTTERDDLAEAAIAQQLDFEVQIPILESQVSELSGQEKELEGYIAALQGKKREMKEELRLFKSSRKDLKASGGDHGAAQDNNVERKVAQAESAFARVLENHTGGAMVGVSTDRNSAAALHELEVLSRKNRIQERLAVIKSKKGKTK